MANLRISLIATLLLLGLHSKAQEIMISGQVIDSLGKPLAFVNIIADDNPYLGTTTNIDGAFSISSSQPITYLTCSFVGFESKTIRIAEQANPAAIKIQLRSISFELGEAVVIAGENPAHRIIRKATQNRHRNNPEKLSSFSCKTYNKFIFDLLPDTSSWNKKYGTDSTLKKSQRKVDDRFQAVSGYGQKHHLLVWETQTLRKYKKPQQYNEEILLNRFSGLQEPQFVMLAQSIQPFSFYGDHLEMLDKQFVNPISPGSTQSYYFELQDTIYQGVDSIFVIAFQPRKGKTFTAFKGILSISTDSYAIQNVIAEPADKVFLHTKFEQSYHKVGSQWFPEALRFTITNEKYPNKYLGLQIQGQTYISEAAINPALSNKDFTNYAYEFAENAFDKSPETWEKVRPEAISDKSATTYQFLDSIGQKINLDRKINRFTQFSLGRYQVGKFDLLLDRLLRFNNFEGTRLGLGIGTNLSTFDKWSASAYAGYGFKNGAWQYGGDIRWWTDKKNNAFARIYYDKDLEQPGFIQLNALTEGFISRNFYADLMDQYEKIGISYQATTWKYLQWSIGFEAQRRQPLYEYNFSRDFNEGPSFIFRTSAAKLGLRYAFGESFVPILSQRLSQGTDYPIAQLNYERGFKNVFDGEFNYHKLIFGVEHEFRMRKFGAVEYRLELGYIDGNLPYNLLFVSSGVGVNGQDFWVRNAFQTMDLYEFLSDQFLHLFFRYEIGNLFWRKPYSQPTFSLIHNVAIGSLQQPEVHQDISFNTIEKGYTEVGLLAEHLIRIPYVNFAYLTLGGAVFYRYGAYHREVERDNIAYRLVMDFQF